jgi:hypothetical protein
MAHTRAARFFWVQITRTGNIYQEDHKTCQNAIQYTKWQQNRPKGHKRYQHLSMQDTPKLTQIWNFCLKMYHLATLAHTTARLGSLSTWFQPAILDQGPIFLKSKKDFNPRFD